MEGSLVCALGPDDQRVHRLLPADAEAKDGDGSVPRAVERFQVYRRETRGGEEPDAVAEQHRQDVYQDLVHQPPPQALARHVSPEDLQVLAPAASGARISSARQGTGTARREFPLGRHPVRPADVPARRAEGTGLQRLTRVSLPVLSAKAVGVLVRPITSRSWWRLATPSLG